MSWAARLDLGFRRDGARCVARSAHEGPLRVLKALYPEGDAICHQVIVHPPGGIVGGDRLHIELTLGADAHAVITTPGATRFYRSAGEPAAQQVSAALAPGARLEWLPAETIAHSGCLAEGQQRFTLEPGAEMIGWELLALGAPAAGEAFEAGRFTQHLELPGVWLERGTIAAEDTRLLQSPVGLAGFSCALTMWAAAGAAFESARAEALLDAARELADAPQATEAVFAGATAVQPQVVVLRALAHRVEPVMALARAVRARWRAALWQLDAPPLRVWRT